MGAPQIIVQFTDLSTGNITVWLWDFGDDVVSLDQNPTHTYTTPDTYTVSLTVYGHGGSDARIRSNYIIVYPAQPGTTTVTGEII
ncbi:MAG: PKD domain-containing protein [Chloroflexota bacterium]|nr:PKD domain-containing protein [Chloroflexota bacterium]